MSLTLNERDRHPEVMDQPGLDVDLHREALRGLGLINRLSRTPAAVWNPIRQLALESGTRRPLRILDIACGGGDVALDLARRAARVGIDVEIEGLDISPTALEFARMTAERQGISNVRFREADVLSGPLPAGFDVVTCTLFLHHLDEHEAGGLLSRMATAAERLVVVSDLRRTRVGYLMANLVGRVLTRSPVVRVDGPLSVRAAFSLEEAHTLEYVNFGEE